MNASRNCSLSNLKMESKWFYWKNDSREIGSKKTDDDLGNIIGDVLLAYSGTAVINCSLRQRKISFEDKRQLSEKTYSFEKVA